MKTNKEVLKQLRDKTSCKNNSDLARYLTEKYGVPISRQQVSQFVNSKTQTLLHLLLKEALEYADMCTNTRINQEKGKTMANTPEAEYTVIEAHDCKAIKGAIDAGEAGALLLHWSESASGNWKADSLLAHYLGCALVAGPSEGLGQWRKELGIQP